jgi:lauroyl/myristoyl acyltransferase
VAVQGDRPTGERGDRLVSFFGSTAAFPLGPFVLARAAGAPVLSAFCTMARDGRYRVDVGAPIWVKPGEDGRPRGHGGRPRSRGARASDAVVQLLRCVGASR